MKRFFLSITVYLRLVLRPPKAEVEGSNPFGSASTPKINKRSSHYPKARGRDLPSKPVPDFERKQLWRRHSPSGHTDRHLQTTAERQGHRPEALCGIVDKDEIVGICGAILFGVVAGNDGTRPQVGRDEFKR